MLNYFAQMRDAEVVYAMILADSRFADDLKGKCSATRDLSGFPTFEASVDDLKDALGGIQAVETSRDAQVSQFAVIKPELWAARDMLRDFDFDNKVLVEGETYRVSDKYTEDFDLFFNPNDVRGVFKFEGKEYEQICHLAAQALDPALQKKQEFVMQDLMEHEFNYLTEDAFARQTLFQVCLFDQFLKEDERQLIRKNPQKFHLLFQ